MQSFRNIWCSIKHHNWKIVSYVFTCYSVLFTLVKTITQFFPTILLVGMKPLSTAVIISVAWAGKKVWKPSKIAIKIAHSNSRLEVLFGDLFELDGIRAISVSEYFETQLGRPVAESSIHGAFLKRHFSGYTESIDKQIGDQLANENFTPKPEKTNGKNRCYPIGSTALIKVPDDDYIWFAVANADPLTCKTSSDVELLWRALHKLWQRARVECSGRPLNLPLVGSGLAGLNLPTRDLLNLLILSVITESKAREVTHTIRIVLWEDRFDDVDLKEVKQYWEQ